MTRLQIWSFERPDLALVIEAKAQVLNEKVFPAYPRSFEDLPALDARVLAIGSRPPFLCDYALTSERTSLEGMVRALRWVLGVESDDPKATTILDTMTAAFGPGTREIPLEEQEAMQRLRDYQQNRV